MVAASGQYPRELVLNLLSNQDLIVLTVFCAFRSYIEIQKDSNLLNGHGLTVVDFL